MSNLELYAASLTVMKVGTVYSVAVAVKAANKNEATGLALNFCQDEFSIDDGYHSHSVHIYEIGHDTIRDCGWVRKEDSDEQT